MSIQESIAHLEPSAARAVGAHLSFAPARPGLGLANPARGHAVLKRAFDLLIAIALLILCTPLLLIIALSIQADSPGPVLFRQTRLGRHGKPFEIVKFRTMWVLENGDTVIQAIRNDPRVTRVGDWLRRTSLDELPQLWNVISGEMSLVGPRPHARAHDKLFAILIENYDLRQTVKPGITGWAQVNGHRGETPTLEAMRRRVELDIWYTRNANPWTDLKILLRTPREVLQGRNAY